ncbi:MAG TPA: transporter substrate-binding domain-containing protein [Methanoregula sp.]|nr:transporter substrate-binding domain-containing protein [Methanoregula sp.]
MVCILHRAFILGIAIILLAALVTPAFAARDVKVALTELKPSLYTNERGDPAGFFVDIVEDIAQKEGWNIIWISGSLTESWDRLAAGEIDVMPAVTSTPERQKSYDFGNESALSVWSQVYARPGSGINTILDLEGKRVASVRGAQSGTGFLDYAKNFDVNVTMLDMDSPMAVFSATAAGDADALVVYNTAGQEDAKTYGLAATPVMFNPVQMTFAVQKGKNRDLLAALDRGIAQGKMSPSSPYNRAMQKWYGIEAGSTIPLWLFWGLGGIAFFAVLFVIMSIILKREVEKKTAELSRQNEKLQEEIRSRRLAEDELKTKNEEINAAYERLSATEEKLRQNLMEINAAYEQITATEEELRHNFSELKKNEQALLQARRKLSLLNTLTFDEIKNAVFAVTGFTELAKNEVAGTTAAGFLHKSEEILHSMMTAMQSAKKFQDLGIGKPLWQDANIALLNAISHLDFARIKRTVDLDGIEIYADPLLEDVFFILMENTLIHGNGATEVRIQYREGPDGLTISIEDNGPGIVKPDKEKIFNRDYKLKGGRGLFLAREILAITDISIRETGESGTGARFEIMVPEGRYRLPAV